MCSTIPFSNRCCSWARVWCFKKTGTRSIDALGGLLKNMKVTGVTFLVGSLAIAGLPPFNGFVSEFFIYVGSFRGIAVGSPVFAVSLLAIVSPWPSSGDWPWPVLPRSWAWCSRVNREAGLRMT